MRRVNSWRIAWLLIGLLTTYWLWFGLASAIEEDLGWRNVVLHLLIPGGLFAIIAAIAWRWRRAGGVLLVVVGGVVASCLPFLDDEVFPTSTVIVVLLTMAAPTIAAGVLLLQARRTLRT